MNETPNPAFDAVHPSGAIMVRSCRGGLLHSVVLSEQVMETDAGTLAEGILRTATVSFMQAMMEIRAELIVGTDSAPSAAVPTPTDLDDAAIALNAHVLRTRHR